VATDSQSADGQSGDDGRRDGLRRRTALERGLWIALGVGAGSVSGVLATENRSGGSPKLSPAQSRKYRALVETLGSLPGTRVNGRHAPKAARELGALYAKSSGEARAVVDAVLGSIDASFTRMGTDQRLAYVAKRLDKPGGSVAFAPGSGMLAALALAAAPFDERGFNWSIDTVELWVTTLRVWRAT
jgi:hypothetical protein